MSGEILDVNIVQIVVGVFFGNICTLVVLWCFKDFSRQDQENISWRAIWAFLMIIGLSSLVLLGQKLAM
jgi:hypothetical protein